jgi:hypothetical protein
VAPGDPDDRLRAAVPLDLLQDPLRRLGSPYSRDDYERVTSASTEELVNAPHAVAERLVAQLLRGLDIAPGTCPSSRDPRRRRAAGYTQDRAAACIVEPTFGLGSGGIARPPVTLAAPMAC